jgi:hypothetical protein
MLSFVPTKTNGTMPCKGNKQTGSNEDRVAAESSLVKDAFIQVLYTFELVVLKAALKPKQVAENCAQHHVYHMAAVQPCRCVHKEENNF